MRRVILPVAVLALLLAGCWTVSIHPLYTKNDIVSEPLLVGQWGDPDNDRGEMWVFAEAGENLYTLTAKENGKPDAVFEARLLRLKNHLFLDLLPKPPEGEGDFYAIHLLPAHSFWRVEVSEDSLRLAMLNREWIEKEITEGRLKIPHVAREDVLVLTASTEELQAFVLSHLKECFEWGDPFVHIK
jgi:hypothetical protein